MSHDLDRSWKKLKQAERLLLDYYDTKFTPGETVLTSPLLSPSNAKAMLRSKAKVSFYGGILNNKNDPSKRTGKGRTSFSPANAFAAKTFDFSSAAAKGRDSTSDLCSSPMFCTYEKPSSSASTITRRPLHQKSAFTGEARPEPFDYDFHELVLSPQRVYLKSRDATRPGTMNKGKRMIGYSSKMTRAMEIEVKANEKIDWIYEPQSPGNPRIGSPFIIQRFTPASMFLDHLVREQSSRKYVKKPVRSVVRIPHVRTPIASFRNTEIQRNLEEDNPTLKQPIYTKQKTVGTEVPNTQSS